MLLMRSLSLLCLSCVSVLADQTPLLAGHTPIAGEIEPASNESSIANPSATGKFTTSDLIALHQKLISIESITGNEKSVGDWLASYLSNAGLTVEKQEVAKDRYNIFAYPGKARKTKVLVTSHIDTVPPYWPYAIKNNGTEVWGRGSVDAKACVAAQIIAVLNLLADKSYDIKDEDLSLLYVVGEEESGDGMVHFSENKPTNYSAVVFGEPTEGKLAAGHKGILGWRVRATGKAAHSGYPSLGVSANEILIGALNEMLSFKQHFPSSKKYGNSTMNIGRISGGVAANVVAEKAEAAFALRIANGSPSDIRHMIHKQLATLMQNAEDEGGKLELEWSNAGYGVVDIDHDIDGFDTITVNYGTDVPNLKGDHKKYLYGPGSIFVAHSDHEHLKISELEQAVQDYQKIILTVLDNE